MSPFDTAHMTFYSTLVDKLTMRLSLSSSTYSELCVNSRLFHLHLALALGVTPFEFR